MNDLALTLRNDASRWLPLLEIARSHYGKPRREALLFSRIATEVSLQARRHVRNGWGVPGMGEMTEAVTELHSELMTTIEEG